jgi:adenylosuccinate lyase
VEQLVCERLGLRPAEASTQVIQRDRHAEYVAALAICASTLDAIATEIRHLARTEVREVREPFAEGQKGSSAMPHKRNPVVSERVSGLARVLRGHTVTALENVTLWHERDISHSSAERLLFPDATGLLAFMLRDLTWVIDGLVVDADRMFANLESTGGLFFSQRVLTALVERGMPREDAYRAVQRAASDTWDRGLHFKERMWEEIADLGVIDQEAYGELFRLAPYLVNLGPLFDRLEALEVSAT